MYVISVNFGKRLKQIMKKENYSGRKLALELGIDAGYLNKVLNNKIQPTCIWIERVLDYLGYAIEFNKKGGRK